MKAQGERSQNLYASQCGVSSAAITKISSGCYAPSAKTLKKLASKAHNGITYQMLMNAAGLGNSDFEINNQSSIQWTEKEKAAGVLPNYAENLSADEIALIDAYRAIKSEKGEQAAHAIKTIVETYLDKK